MFKGDLIREKYALFKDCCDLWERFVEAYLDCFCLACRTTSILGPVNFDRAPALQPFLMTAQLNLGPVLCLLCHQEKGF